MFCLNLSSARNGSSSRWMRLPMPTLLSPAIQTSIQNTRSVRDLFYYRFICHQCQFARLSVCLTHADRQTHKKRLRSQFTKVLPCGTPKHCKKYSFSFVIRYMTTLITFVWMSLKMGNILTNLNHLVSNE